MAHVPVSTAFASDNAAPAHPAAMAALQQVNTGSAAAYGADQVSTEAADALRATFEAPDAEVLFTFTGTAANIIALASAVRPWQEVLCSDIAHVLVDEAGGPVRLSGAPLTRLPSDDGLIDPTALDRHAARRGPVHHSQPRIVSITQSTENGRVWNPAALAEFVDHAHDLDLLVHIDGSRLANAVAALGVSAKAAIGDADIVTVGGTKNGMLFGDALLIRRPEHFAGIRFVQKQIGHLASKNRFVAAQFSAFLRDGLWLRTAAHANTMAARLGAGFERAGLRLACPVEANEVFVELDADTHRALGRHYAAHQPDPDVAVVRFVCAWSTTDSEVDQLLETVRALKNTS
ncbi:low specificity L-threonine aldolase [Mycobacterium sp. SMC-4]|uniref:threonine aldolase family protein n=1 Tax=Mycobacterium sp. SMC-4 TaxID=2857059 RepID=UPI0021B388B7|nr:beta-eliminating lyase-related protein [Mycobacterium sp. SMC-4]UXA18837.1 aminotransferase class V-fold PLP-dependent enzyme [Mycobacterium sp. SMC-4]